jgi:hypothetical protein
MSPFLKWTLAAIAGGGAAGVVQGTTVLVRGTSTATTAGLGNPLVATAELGGAVTVSILSLIAPVLAALVVAGLLFVLIRKVLRRANRVQSARIKANAA